MITGKIKVYNQEQGFGFIVDENKTEYFFKIKKDEPTIKEGSRVTFKIINGYKGEEAQIINPL